MRAGIAGPFRRSVVHFIGLVNRLDLTVVVQ
jgi:hypothetical protein